MKQYIMQSSPSLRPSAISIRFLSMGENLWYIIDRENPKTKFVLWQHNFHIGKDREWGTLGSQLQRKYGKEYYGFSLEFNQGSFQKRLLLPDNVLGDLMEAKVPPAPEGSLPWHLSRANLGNLILNLRTTVDNPIVKQWLHTPQKFTRRIGQILVTQIILKKVI